METCLLNQELPNEVWFIILVNLDFYAVRLSSVSKYFYDIAPQCITSLNSVLGSWRNPHSPFCNIGMKINDEYILRFTNLTELNHSHFIPPTTSLIKLNVNEISISDIGLKSLKNLTDLNLTMQVRISDEGIKELTKLRILSLTGNYDIIDNGLKYLTNLTRLDISRNYTISDDCLKEMTYLTQLDLTENRVITDFGLKGLTNLTDLDLKYNIIITFEGLKELTHLTHLDLSFSSLCLDPMVIEKFKKIIDLNYEDDYLGL